MWLYHSLDLLSTLTEAFGLFVVTTCFCKKFRFHAAVCRIVPPAAYAAIVWVMTWFSDLGAFKIFILYIFTIGIIKLFYKEPLYYAVLVIEITNTISTIFPEAIGETLMARLYDGDITTRLNGVLTFQWQVYLCILVIRFLALGIIYILLKNYAYKIQLKDFAILTVNFSLLFITSFISTYHHLNLQIKSSPSLNIIIIFISVLFMVQFLYSRNVSCLRVKEQQNQMQIAMLKQQHSYYEDKLKEEMRVRSIYHDLKNHLLIMEGQKEVQKTRQMARELLSQIEGYENYVHTGNDFLDIIIKDKAEKARAEQIDFSALINFNGIDFIDPLDLSTIFGNAVDNAIEASRKLPLYDRMITIKAGTVRDMLIITVENHMPPEVSFTGETTKDDVFFHGFGITNINRSIEKYEGQLSIRAENGTFLLKAVIPLP